MPPPTDPPKENDDNNQQQAKKGEDQQEHQEKHTKERSALDDSDIELLKSYVSGLSTGDMPQYLWS